MKNHQTNVKIVIFSLMQTISSNSLKFESSFEIKLYHNHRKTFGKFFRSYSELLSKFGDISFQEYLSKGISHPVFYGDLVYKLRRVKDTPNFISSGSKIVKRLRRRQYDPVIIERTIGLVLGPSTALYRSFLKHFTLTNKAVGIIWLYIYTSSVFCYDKHIQFSLKRHETV